MGVVAHPVNDAELLSNVSALHFAGIVLVVVRVNAVKETPLDYKMAVCIERPGKEAAIVLALLVHEICPRVRGKLTTPIIVFPNSAKVSFSSNHYGFAAATFALAEQLKNESLVSESYLKATATNFLKAKARQFFTEFYRVAVALAPQFY